VNCEVGKEKWGRRKGELSDGSLKKAFFFG
jgi:hypothetical protein